MHRTLPLLARLLAASVLIAVLSACTSDSDEADSASSAPEVAMQSDSDLSTPETSTSSGGMTVRTIVDRVATAWPNVETIRVVSMSGTVPSPNSPSTPESAQTMSVEEWSAPNNRRIVEYVSGTVVNEQRFVDGVVYMRGIFVSTSVAPEVGPETWIILDPTVVPRDTPVGARVTYLTRQPGTPFGSMTEDMLSVEVRDSGTVTVNDRRCQLYTFGDESNRGDEIRYEVAIDENDFPCQVVQRAGQFQNSNVYDVNSGDVLIVAPLEGTPVSGTPEG